MLLAVALFSACNKSDNSVTDFKRAYFPVDSGRYVIYEVDSVTWNSFYDPPRVDSAQFEVRESYGESFTDGSGIDLRRIERHRRADSISPWYLTDVWSAGIDNNRGIWNEENLRFIKLVFPPDKGATWHGNEYINTNQGPDFLGDWDYKIVDVDVPRTVNGITFDSTLSVLLYADSNLIEKTVAREIYAKGVGLVYKEWMHLTKNRVDVQFPEGTEDGFIVRMQVKAFGDIE